MRRARFSSFLVVGLILHVALLVTGLVGNRKEVAKHIRLTFQKVGGGGNGGIVHQVPEVVKTPRKIQTSEKIVAQNVNSTAAPATASTEASSGDGGNGPGEGGGETGGSGNGSGAPDPLKVYGSRVADLLNKNKDKNYPLMARRLQQEGLVIVKITVDKNGKLLEQELVKESMYRSLNKAAVELVKSVEPYPPLPSEFESDVVSFNVPINYKLN